MQMKKNMLKRWVSMMLSITVAVSLNVSSVKVHGDSYSESNEKIIFDTHEKETNKLLAEGNCGEQGDNVKYAVYDDGTLYIYGKGKMEDYNVDKNIYAPYLTDDLQIETLVVESGVTGLGKGAFFYMCDLKEVILPEGLEMISEEAFLACNQLTCIAIPGTVTQIEDYALGYKLTNGKYGSVEKKNLTIFGTEDSAAKNYAESNEMTFELSAKRYESGKCGENVEWELDCMTGKLKVFGSGDMYNFQDRGSPFYYNNKIKSVEIEDGVTSIGDYAFFCCEKITSVRLAKTVKTIGEYAFALSTVTLRFGNQSSNPALKTIVLPDGVECIKQHAFEYSGLETIYLSKTVKEIDDRAFFLAGNLERIDVSEENMNYTSRDGVLYTKDLSALKCYPLSLLSETYRVPKETRSFSNYCFAGAKNNLKTIIFSEDFEDMGTQTYAFCNNLSTVIFPGEPPKAADFYYNISNQIKIYCSFSDEKWKGIMDGNVSGKTINWIDLDSFGSELVIEAEKTDLNVDEGIQMRAEISPVLADEFYWNSSDTDVAVVSNDGFVKAIGAGTAKITVKSQDLKYSSDISIHVTGDKKQFSQYEITTLEDEEFKYEGGIFKEIPYEKLNGMYIFNQDTLYLYSFFSQRMDKIESFEKVQDVYFEGEILYILANNRCKMYNLTTQSLLSEFAIKGYDGTAVGADSSGRIYIGAVNTSNSDDYKIFLYLPTGEMLSKTSVGTKVHRFNGFDSTNGNFYMETEYDWYAWGYSHPGYGLTMGNVTDNRIKYVETSSGFLEQSIISRTFSCIQYLGQNIYYQHNDYAALLGNKYLAAISIITSQLNVYDSNQELPALIMSRNRKTPEYELAKTNRDTASVGVMTVYDDKKDTIITYENGKRLVEYNPHTGEEIASVDTAHYVFNLFWYEEDYLIAIEKEDNQYYMEVFQWNIENLNFSLKPEKNEMNVGDTQQIEIIHSGGKINYTEEWYSSDNKVATVTQNGKVVAWGTGEVTITCRMKTTGELVKCTIKVSVTENIKNMRITRKDIKEDAVISNNVSDNNYSVWSSVINSYLFENNDNTLTRLENVDGGIIIEKYSDQYELTSSHLIESELPVFGGFFNGEQYNFLVFGEKNSNEIDANEVMRIVKYSKDWDRIDSCSVYGGNTYIPFDAGSLRMSETNDKLYIHTCHTMYKTDDGLNHQANMTFVLDKNEMSIVDSYYNIMNISYGYVSHSFNQFIQNDGEYVYRIDHGDAYPRAVALTKCSIDGSVTEVDWKEVFHIANGDFSNYTGVSVGGMELSESNCLVVGNSIDQENITDKDDRNIFLAVTDKNLEDTNIIWLTNYTDGDIVVKTPQIIKLKDEHFLVLWEEFDSGTKVSSVKAVTVDGDGNIAMSRSFYNMRLSDCQPIHASDGSVRWYVTDGTKMVFYAINPYFTVTSGDVTGDGEIDLKDSAVIKRHLAGWDVELDEQAADLNGDGHVDIKDSALIKRYLAGWEVTFAE